MTDIEQLLRSTLTAHAEPVEDADPTSRAQQVITEAQQARTKRRLTALGLSLAVLAAAGYGIHELTDRETVAVPDTMGEVSATPTTRATMQASTSATSSPTAATRSTAVASHAIPTPVFPAGTSAEAALAKLPSGTDAETWPRVVTTQGRRQILVPGGQVAMPEGARDIAHVVADADGWIIRTASESFTGGGPDSGAEIVKVTRDGKLTQVAAPGTNSMMVPSPDGTRLAYTHAAEPVRNGAGAELRIVPLDGSKPAERMIGAGSTKLNRSTISVLAWTASGIVIEGNLMNEENRRLYIVDPDTGAMRESQSLENIVQVAPGRTIQVTEQGDQRCADLVEAGRADRSLLCDTDLFVMPGATGGAWVEGSELASGAAVQQVPGVFVDPAGTVSAATRPAWLEMNTWAADDGRPGAVLVQQSVGEEVPAPVWVRWDLAGGRLEKVTLAEK